MTQQSLFDIIPGGNDRKSFYNTIKETGITLQKSESDANSQENIILKVFESGEKFTPLAIERLTKINHDSVKRAITNLTNKGKLIKLGKEEMILESRGKMNHRWQIKDTVDG
mgnify:CR=1